MTSSFILKKLDQDQKKGNYRWSNGSPNHDFSEYDSPLGGLEHTHLKINGDCHPDFYAVPVGGPYNAKLCRRKPESVWPTKEIIQKKLNETKTGYYRAVVNLYDVNTDYPTREWNPDYFSDRRIPWEADLIREDYLRLPIKYNATGIETIRTPHELRDKNHPYFEYGFSYLPHEDPKTGRRIATNLDQSVPPPKYDVTQLHQRLPIFKKESEYVGVPLNFKDEKYTKRIV